MKRSFQIVVALAMIALLSIPAVAQDAEKKGKKKKGNRQNPQIAALLKRAQDVGVGEEAIGKIKEAAAELAPKLKAASEKLGPDVRKKMAEARKAAAADGKKGKDLQAAVAASLTEEEQAAFKEQQALLAGFRKAVADIVGPEKAKELKLGGRKKGAGKGKGKKKADS